MDYSEIPAPEELRRSVKLAWTLRVTADAGANVRHVATPDGCMEIIRRLRGHSSWDEEQPEQFVAGVITRPAELQLGGGSHFIGLRIWPWAWTAVASIPSSLLIDRWSDLREAAPGIALPETAEVAFEAVAGELAASDPLAEIILSSRSVAEIARRSGRSHRWLQRWFERNVGVAPRTYLRLLRFSETLDDLPATAGSLAHHAAEHGYADQAHMSREFRSMSGASAKAARKTAVGPFLADTGQEALPS